MVQCADCGLLGLRSRTLPTLLEVNDFYRENGFDEASIGGFGAPRMNAPRPAPTVDRLPVCSAQRHIFTGEPPVKDELLAERECSAFVQWRRGTAPKEYEAEMERQIEVERDERRHGEMMGVLKMQLWIMGVGMIVTTLLAAIVASLISAALR